MIWTKLHNIVFTACHVLSTQTTPTPKLRSVPGGSGAADDRKWHPEFFNSWFILCITTMSFWPLPQILLLYEFCLGLLTDGLLYSSKTYCILSGLHCAKCSQELYRNLVFVSFSQCSKLGAAQVVT